MTLDPNRDHPKKSKFFNHMFVREKLKNALLVDYLSKIKEQNPLVKDSWITVLTTLSFEEVIYLKLYSMQSMMKTRFIGIPIYHILKRSLKKAIFMYSCNTNATPAQVAFAMGTSVFNLNILLKEYNSHLNWYFKHNNNNNNRLKRHSKLKNKQE